MLEMYCRHIVAWTALEFPWKDRPLPDDIKAAVQSHDSPPLLKEMDPEGMVEFFNALSCTVPFGYDMENDYRECLCHPVEDNWPGSMRC